MSDKILEVVIMIGLPGSGKSTLAKLNYASYELISLDEIANHERRKEQELIEENLRNGKSVVVCDTNLTREIRGGHITIASKYNTRKIGIFLHFHLDTILLHNSSREKAVPDASIFKMQQELELPSYDEGFDEIRIISSTEDTVGRLAVNHTIYTDGASKKEGNFIGWIDDLTKEEFAGRSQGKDIFRCEYLAIIHALQNNKSLSFGDEITIMCDNKTVVEQLNGKWNVNEEDIRQYVMLIHSITRNYAKVNYVWVRNEENKAGKLLGK
jgi:bifunctional polynucleotide phosphatase/kinase